MSMINKLMLKCVKDNLLEKGYSLNNIVNLNETCELPGTSNNPFCIHVFILY